MFQRFVNLSILDASDDSVKKNHNITQFRNNFEHVKKCDICTEDQCSICIGTLENDNFIKTKCNHVFHYLCMENWIKSIEIPNCPNCKKFFEMSVISFEIDKLDENELLIFNNLNNILIHPTTQYLNIKNILKLFSGEEPSVKIYNFGFNSNAITISINSIKWFVNINLVNMGPELYGSYLKIKTENNANHFDVDKNQYKSKLVIYEVSGHHIEITIAQSNFLLWFIKNNCFEKIIDCKLLIPQQFRA
jgi:hypothetical protein